MENPATWSELERVIAQALVEAAELDARGVIGASTPKRIASALRQAGLVRDFASGDE